MLKKSIIILNAPFRKSAAEKFLSNLCTKPIYRFEYPSSDETKNAHLDRIDVQDEQDNLSFTFLSFFGNQSLRSLKKFTGDFVGRILGHVLLVHDYKYKLSEADFEMYLLGEENPQEFGDAIWANVSIILGKDRILEIIHITPSIPFAVLTYDSGEESRLSIDEIRHLLHVGEDILVDRCDLNDKASIKQFLLRFLRSLEQNETVKSTIALVEDL